MTPDLTNQVTAGLLILTLLSVLLIALMLTLFAVCYLKRSRHAIGATLSKRHITPRAAFASFDAPSRWFAVKSNNTKAVADVLELDNPEPCSWGEGMSRLNEHSLFVSPPVNGWILIVGHAVPDFTEDVDECFRFVLRLSRSLGHVQYFAVNRAVNHHSWVNADDGEIKRAYAWAGETLWNQGDLTEEENELGLRCFGYGEEPESIQFNSTDSQAANAEKMGLLAARWSLDPGTIDTSMLPAEHGIAGDPIHSRQF